MWSLRSDSELERENTKFIKNQFFVKTNTWKRTAFKKSAGVLYYAGGFIFPWGFGVRVLIIDGWVSGGVRTLLIMIEMANIKTWNLLDICVYIYIQYILSTPSPRKNIYWLLFSLRSLFICLLPACLYIYILNAYIYNNI